MYRLVLLFFLLPICLWGQFIREKQNERFPYYISACAMFQQEGRFLKEWIEYHKLQGIEHFYLYNNGSTDDYLSVLAPYIESGEVELFWWPSNPNEDWTPHQKRAIRDAVERASISSFWLTILDIDEFIVPTEHGSLREFLEEHEHGCSQVLMMWRFFGTNNIEKIPDDHLMIETLTKRCRFVPGEIWHHKSIVKPRLVQYASIHDCAVKHEPSVINFATATEEYPPLILHHYWTRDIEFLKMVKQERQERLHNRKMTEEELDLLINSYNQVEDQAILRFVAPLRQIIFGTD